jgi:hypothetical protein
VHTYILVAAHAVALHCDISAILDPDALDPVFGDVVVLNQRL